MLNNSFIIKWGIVVACKNTSEGDRTLDHRLKRLTLYQLSYAGY